MKIYVASSWRNKFQQAVVLVLRYAGHEVYDFKHPREGDNGFQWSEIDPQWESWDVERYRNALSHPVAERGFKNDFDAMVWADTCVLVLPCGRSAHTEAGWMRGAGKPTIVYIPTEKEEPELMYKVFDKVCVNLDELCCELALTTAQMTPKPEDQ